MQLRPLGIGLVARLFRICLSGGLRLGLRRARLGRPGRNGDRACRFGRRVVGLVCRWRRLVADDCVGYRAIGLRGFRGLFLGGSGFGGGGVRGFGGPGLSRFCVRGRRRLGRCVFRAGLRGRRIDSFFRRCRFIDQGQYRGRFRGLRACGLVLARLALLACLAAFGLVLAGLARTVGRTFRPLGRAVVAPAACVRPGIFCEMAGKFIRGHGCRHADGARLNGERL